MSISDTVNIMVDNAYSQSKLQMGFSVGVLKKAMDSQSAMSAKLLETMPEVQNLAPAGEVGSIIDVYA